MVDKLPKWTKHGGHASYIEPINGKGSLEQRFDGEGNLMDAFVTVKDGKGRRKLL